MSAIAALGSVATGLSRALDALLPAACVACGRGVDPTAPPVCVLCWHRLPELPPPWCSRCGAPRTRTVADASPSGSDSSCAECDEMPGLRAAAPYRLAGPAAELVRSLKYGRWVRLADPMGAAMASAARRLGGGNRPVLVPVPIAPARRRERGFNQAEALARGLARATGWSILTALERSQSRGHQVGRSRGARLQAVRGLFAVGPSVDPAAGPALLVDDVVTTGATAIACLEALEEGGFARVGVVTFARALRPPEESLTGKLR